MDNNDIKAKITIKDDEKKKEKIHASSFTLV